MDAFCAVGEREKRERERERERERVFNRAEVYLFFTLDEIVLLRGSRFHARLWKNLKLLLPCPSVNRTALPVKSS